MPENRPIFLGLTAMALFVGLAGCDRTAAEGTESPEPSPQEAISPTDGASVVPTGAGGPDTAVAGPDMPQRAYTDESMECVTAESTPRYADTGYDHIVRVTNGCTAVVQCEVSTDVDPAWIVVRIGESESTEVKTRVSAEDNEYEPRLQCTYYD